MRGVLSVRRVLQAVERVCIAILVCWERGIACAILDFWSPIATSAMRDIGVGPARNARAFLVNAMIVATALACVVVKLAQKAPTVSFVTLAISAASAGLVPNGEHAESTKVAGRVATARLEAVFARARVAGRALRALILHA